MRKSLALGMLAASSMIAQALPPDAATVVTTANTAFESAGALAVLIVGFVIVRRLVRKLVN